MRILRQLLFVALGAGGLVRSDVDKRQTSLDSWIASERTVAKAGILANIGPNGAKDQGAASGVVIASPSTVDPDYVYLWTRDAALVFKLLVDEYISGRDTSLLTTIQNFIESQKRVQQVSNPSGTVSTGGLGEPKFLKNEQAFTGGWGRPQRDGPALRATTLITFANAIEASNPSYVTGTLWPMLQLDLDYVATYWNQTGFDLWEEVNGSSFFTTAVQHRSLREGAAFATKRGDTTRATRYTTQAANVLCFLQSYWNPTGRYIVSNVNVNIGRTGLDANSVLTAVHSFDPNAGPDPITWQPGSDKALANLKAVVDSFRGSLYAINSGRAANAAVAVGRYKEDVYYGGHPWYLTTSAAAEQLYLGIYQWNKAGGLNVTTTSLAFWQQLVPGTTVGTYASSSTTYTTLRAAAKTFADGFLSIVQQYQGTGGALAEQFNKANGTPLSAADLTWSYAAALTAFNARDGLVSGTWGAAGLAVPTTCSGGGGGNTVSITFRVQATTVWGENIFLTGSLSQLSTWDPNTAIALSASAYPIWAVTVNIPASTAFQYKFIRKYNGAVTWESDPNRSYTSPASGSVTLTDTWR